MPLARYRPFLAGRLTVRLAYCMEISRLAIRTYVATVQAVARRTPGVARITFGGGDLDQFEPKGPDQFLYVLLPPPGCPDLTVDASFTWEHYQSMDDLGRGEVWEQVIQELIPMGRAGTGEDIAHIVVYLCSDEGSWVTGQSWNVDGGTVVQH